MKLILLRHGQSTWNESNLFTGWVDVPLSALGESEAASAGRLLAEAELLPDVCHTSVLRRAIQTAYLALEECGRHWIAQSRSWRLNERHYGALQGLDKSDVRKQYGDEQLHVWRRSYDVPPPPSHPDSKYDVSRDARYADISFDIVPATECLADVVLRMMPYWYDSIVPDLRANKTVLVAAHGNSLRALVKHLEGISDDDIAELNIPTGVPRVYELDSALRPTSMRELGDPQAIRAAAEAVANQAKR